MATLHVVAGKAGAGKTTLARKLAADVRGIVICEDEWLSRLADPINDLRDYLAAAAKIRRVVAPLATDLLRLGVPVVFDFAGNTVRDRSWVKSIAVQAQSDLTLHYIHADDHTCRARVAERNRTQPEGLFFGVVAEALVDEVNRHVAPPTADEGLTVVTYDA